ncbi:MAG: hypothetical protein EHM61_23540 [Acidobacteria bacterium]|nr:MAG: hypothetical protein EHM61_23540 [Acidobacteriota bacterium]
MQAFLRKANWFFDLPLTGKTRVLIVVAVLTLIVTYVSPLWYMAFYSNQYTDGLVLDIYTFKLEGGKTPNRDDLQEINSLNHYIGMRPLLESDFSEFTWLPFVIGALMLLSLRAAVLGKMANLVDVVILFAYFGLFSLWSFYHRLYMYGHNLDPTAAIKVEPFTPPIFGEKVIANFTVQSYPQMASYALVMFWLLLMLAVFFSWRQPETARSTVGEEKLGYVR